jgi:hypothetical protein
VKDFAYVSLENDSEVSIWMSSLYMTNIIRVYGQIYMSDGDKFKETFEGVQSLKRRAIPYGPNEPLTSTSSKLNKSYDVYGLFFMIPKKSTSAFVKLFKEIMISKQMKKTIEAYKANQKANKIQTNQLFDALTSFDSNTWKSITTSCQKTFENARKEENSLDALILNYDINFALKAMYNYNGDNFMNEKEIKKTGWCKENTTDNDKTKKTKIKIEK